MKVVTTKIRYNDSDQMNFAHTYAHPMYSSTARVIPQYRRIMEYDFDKVLVVTVYNKYVGYEDFEESLRWKAQTTYKLEE